MYPLELQTAPWTEKHIKGAVSSSSTQSSGIPYTQELALVTFSPKTHMKSTSSFVQPTTEPQACLTTKNKTKTVKDKLYLMIAPPISRQRVERNRTKLQARIKHSMLIFTSISVNKNNSFYNSEGKKIQYQNKYKQNNSICMHKTTNVASFFCIINKNKKNTYFSLLKQLYQSV